MRRLIVVSAGVASLLLAGTGSAPATPTAIHDCASFRAWFHQQPGAVLTLEADEYWKNAPAPRTGSDRLELARDAMSYYRGNAGGGGCVGAFYDASHGRAAFVDQYDSARDLGETLVATPPAGIRSGIVATPTHNGVALGMTRRRVEAIEGPGRVRRHGADVIVTYAWSVPSKTTPPPNAPAPVSTYSPELFAMSFLLRGDRVIALDYFAGF
jgi:hypothetical protein